MAFEGVGGSAKSPRKEAESPEIDLGKCGQGWARGKPTEGIRPMAEYNDAAAQETDRAIEPPELWNVSNPQ